jgi:hypothetical protein
VLGNVTVLLPQPETTKSPRMVVTAQSTFGSVETFNVARVSGSRGRWYFLRNSAYEYTQNIAVDINIDEVKLSPECKT